MNRASLMPDPIPADESDPRIPAALAELRDLILQRFPDATFSIYHGEDPDGIRLSPMVDVEDLDEVTDVVIDRLADMQVEEGLPIYVIPDWPLARVRAYLQQQAKVPIEAR